MDTSNKNLKKVLELFERKGIDKRKQASTMADILGIKYQSAKQKLDGKRGVFYSELKSIYDYFHESLDEAKPYNGIFIVNDMHVRCNIVVSEEKVDIKEPGINYAYFHKNYYVVNPTSAKFSKDMKQVIRMDFLPAPKLAILDNDKELLELLKSVSNRYGIDASVYETAQEMMQAVDREDYDGYVVDWLLDYSENSEAVIKKIRSKSETVPIILLTGQLNQHEREIGEIIMEYGVELVEKPTRVFILSSHIAGKPLFLNGTEMELIKLTAEHIKEMYDIRFSVTENFVHAHQIEYLQREVILADVAQGGGWICKIDGSYVGYGLGIHIPHALIGGLFVRPEYQGQGVGGAILEKITAWFFEQGDTEIELTTDEHSSAARFYQARGWHSCGHDEYGQLIMKKRKMTK